MLKQHRNFIEKENQKLSNKIQLYTSEREKMLEKINYIKNMMTNIQ